MDHPRRITPASFRPYGKVIGYPGKGQKGTRRNLWRIILTEHAQTGWRIAYLVVRDKRIRRLEAHPGTYESFEPVRGRSLLFVTKHKEGPVRCFLLDQPIILNKNIWHGVVTITPETEIKITENAKVACRYWPLKSPLPANA